MYSFSFFSPNRLKFDTGKTKSIATVGKNISRPNVAIHQFCSFTL